MSSTGGGGGRYGPYTKGSSGWSIWSNEEFQEDDVWGVRWETREIDSHSTTVSRRQSTTTAARMIPKPINGSPINESKLFQQSSAPVNVPDWSKIYGNKSSTNDASWGGGDGSRGGDGDGLVMNKNSWDSDEENDDDESVLPPHLWIARKLARSQISSFSVYEGVGRTLKGRDLSNVRNAVLTKTGFIE